MRVICIEDIFEQIPEYEDVKEDPCFGEIYHVTDAFKDEDGEWYTLAEFKKDSCYEQSEFIPLSNIDERELVNEITKESTMQLHEEQFKGCR